MRFCDEPAEFAIYEIDDIEYHKCPVQEITDESYEALSLYSFYKNGFLPEAGGVLDQDYRVIQQIRIIDAVLAGERKQ